MVRRIFKNQKAAEVILVFAGAEVSRATDARKVYFTEGSTLLEVALKNKLPLAHSCGGMGTCGTCRVEIIDAPVALDERNEIETEMALERGFTAKERLACQLCPRAGLAVRFPTPGDSPGDAPGDDQST